MNTPEELSSLSREALEQRVDDLQVTLGSLALYAERVLTASPPEVAGYSFLDFYSPRSMGSNSFFDYVDTPAGHVAITIGNANAFTPSCSLLAARLLGELRGLLAYGIPPAQALYQVSKSLELLGLFENASIASLAPNSAEIEFVHGGTQQPILSNASGIRLLQQNEVNMPIGILPDTLPRSTVKLSLKPGDCLTLYTEGIINAVAASREFYGADRLMRQVEVFAGEPAQIAHAVAEDLDRFTEGGVEAVFGTLVCIVRQA